MPSDIRRLTLRLAVAAVIVGLAIPLMPIWGGSGRGPFIFSQGLPVRRVLIPDLLRWWDGAVVAVVGIWFLRRDRLGHAGGVFVAVGLVVAFEIAFDVIVTVPHFGHWQTDLILALETMEAILLMLAGWHALRLGAEVQTGESPSPESRPLIGDRR